MIQFPVGTSGEVLIFSASVLRHLEKYRQRKWWQLEAGGLLFARFDGKRILIEDVSGPRGSDIRTRWSYWPSRRAEQLEIDERYTRGLHYIGDWHSHAECVPTPSGRDCRTMASRVQESRHELAGFVFAIIGLAPLPTGLTVLVHDGSEPFPLTPA